MLSNRTKIILKINHFQVFNFFYPIKITIQFENWCLLFRTILYSSHYFWIKKHFQGQSNYFLNITPYINMQLIDGSVVRSNHMIGFNQSGHLCCLLAFGGRLIVWGHQRARWSRGVRRVFHIFRGSVQSTECVTGQRTADRHKMDYTGTENESHINRDQRSKSFHLILML